MLACLLLEKKLALNDKVDVVGSMKMAAGDVGKTPMQGSSGVVVWIRGCDLHGLSARHPHTLFIETDVRVQPMRSLL